jgi:hypothetical protein
LGRLATAAGGYTELARGDPPVDTDHDRMPDDWETDHGLDPSDASDGNRDLDGNGYTNVEEYLHWLLLRHASDKITRNGQRDSAP